MTIFCNPQQISTVPTTIAGFQLNGQSYFNMQPQNIRCFYYEGSSSYGSMLSTGPCTDVYIAAAVISKNAGAPVRLQWMRWDEHGWDAYGPAAMYDVKAGVDAAGNITALDWTAYGQGGTSLMPTSEQVGFATWPAVPATGGPASADSPYKVAVANKRVLAKTQPLYAGGLKSAALRAPGAPQSHFAGEQLIDELAYAANMDPVAFRKLNVDPAQVGAVGPVGQRWLAALNGAAILSNWQAKVANSVKQTGNIRKGRGISFGTFGNSQVATVADVSVNIKSRQDHGGARLRCAQQRDHREPRPDRKPGRGRLDHGALEDAPGATRVLQGACHERRLGHLPDPPLRRHAARHGEAWPRPANRREQAGRRHERPRRATRTPTTQVGSTRARASRRWRQSPRLLRTHCSTPREPASVRPR